MRLVTILSCQPFFQVFGNKFFSIVGYNRVRYSKVGKYCTETFNYISCWNFRTRESFKPTGSSIGNGKNFPTFLFVEPVHKKSLPRSAFFPFVCGILQSRSVFVAIGAVDEELLDMFINKRPPSCILNNTLQCVNTCLDEHHGVFR